MAEWCCLLGGAKPTGPMSAEELQSLARTGCLAVDDPVRQIPGGAWTRARSLDWLAFPGDNPAPLPPPPAKPSRPRWYAAMGGQYLGPMTRAELQHLLQRLPHGVEDAVRHGSNGPWLPVREVRGLLFGPQRYFPHPSAASEPAPALGKSNLETRPGAANRETASGSHRRSAVGCADEDNFPSPPAEPMATGCFQLPSGVFRKPAPPKPPSSMLRLGEIAAVPRIVRTRTPRWAWIVGAASFVGATLFVCGWEMAQRAWREEYSESRRRAVAKAVAAERAWRLEDLPRAKRLLAEALSEPGCGDAPEVWEMQERLQSPSTAAQ